MSVSMEGKSKQVYLIMKDRKFRYCLYRVSPPETETSEEEATVKSLDEPLLMMDKATFPELMSFKAIGSRLFMVGGFGRLNGDDRCTNFDKVFVYDIGSSTLSIGPSLICGKSNPILFTFGSRLFALSRMIHCNWDNDALDCEPRFEVLDTDHFDHGWSALPLPKFPTRKSRIQFIYNVEASAAVCVGSKEVIFISVSEAGTYAFDVDRKVWHQVSKEILPFHSHANTFPDVGSLCFGYSSKSKRLSVFRFHYYVADENDESSIEFQVFESEVETPTDLSPPHSPVLYHYGRSITILGSSGEIYSLKGGVDTVGARNTFIGNRYVRVAGFVLSNIAANKTKKWSLKKCEKKRKKMERMGSSSEQHDETMELSMTLSWQDVFFGGPMCDVQHVTAAFVA